MTARHSTHRWWRPAVVIGGISARLHEMSVRAPAVVVLALTALILALVFTPGAGP